MLRGRGELLDALSTTPFVPAAGLEEGERKSAEAGGGAGEGATKGEGVSVFAPAFLLLFLLLLRCMLHSSVRGAVFKA